MSPPSVLRAIWLNLVLAVWVSIAWAGYDLVFIIRHAEAINRFYSPFTPRVVFFPIVVGGGQLYLWARIYRERDFRARWAAGFVAAFFTLQLIIMGLQASVQLPIVWWHAALFAYFAVSHALFASVRGAEYR
jgi:hypothetical protein